MIKLLLVEDDVNLSYIVQAGLQKIIGGYEVTVAENGKEGIEAWENWKPDIIISDIDMPVMNGFEMVKRIRETDGCKKRSRLLQQKRRCCYSSDVAKLMFSS